MLKLEYVIPAAIISAIAVVAFLVLLRRCLRPKTLCSVTPQSRPGGILAFHQASPLSRRRPHRENFNRANSYRLLQTGIPAARTPHFTWADHPSSVTDAAENGWSRFAFAPPSTKSPFTTSDEGPTDLMQKIRLNPESKRGVTSNNTAVITAALPLPGPNLGPNSSFPQEAYFEITVTPQLSDEVGAVSVCVGLTGDNPPPSMIPGTYKGSIGFNSAGSIYLEGSSVFESKTHPKSFSNKVIGCGYSPNQRKVLFTVDSHLVHECQCSTESFSYPLFPTISSKEDITVLVNFGQSLFRYSPANLLRNPNPCFTRSTGAFGFEEDSKELFSMGRIDSQWLRRGERTYNKAVSGIRATEYDPDSDGELFDIELDKSVAK